MLLQTRWHCGQLMVAALLAFGIRGAVDVVGFCWLARVLDVLVMYMPRWPSRRIRSVDWTKLSLYALLLYLPVLNGKARVVRVDLVSFLASGWAGSARRRDSVLTHAVSMNVSRLLMLKVEAAYGALMLAERSRRFSSDCISCRYSTLDEMRSGALNVKWLRA